MSYTEKQYAKPIINEYICRLDFTNNIEWTDNDIPQHLSNEAKKIGYGVVNVIPKNEDTIQFEQKRVKRDRKQFNEWQFIGDYGNKFIISKSSIVHSVKKYASYPQHRDEMMDLLKMLAEKIKNMAIKRIGMRYINIIDTLSSYQNLSSFFNSDYIPTMPACSLGFNPVKLMNNAEFKTAEDYYLRLVYGFFNPDHPSVIRKHDYVFDIDCYYNSIISPKEVFTIIESFHDNIQHVFETAITDQLRSFMDET